MKSEEIRQKFLTFFKNEGHKVLPSASLIPPVEDKSSLFVSAGVQPLAPYILGEPHPLGKRIVNIQKCVRVQDIDEVGDNTHDTFFEMMGNWSFNDYFKEDAIKWSFELLTDKEKGFGLDPKRLYITVFEGDENAPKDTESFEIWKKYMPENRIYFMSAKSNWWSAGDNGPCGPDTEMFYDITPEGLGDLTKEEYMKADGEQKVVEIWNDVFMEYLKKDGKVVGKLQTKNVDTGSGLERIVMAVQKKNNIFDTDIFKPLMVFVSTLTPNQREQRIIADHFRTVVFMISDGVIPSNSDRGYVLRRLIRRAVFLVKVKNISEKETNSLVDLVELTYGNIYRNITEKQDYIKKIIWEEIIKFIKTLNDGLREFNKLILKNNKVLDGSVAYKLFTSYGFPLELSLEMAEENFKNVAHDTKEIFKSLMQEHQEISKVGSESKFKGGLAGTGEMETKYHTATHLLHQALRDVLGDEVKQMGSNITAERLRFDFSFPRKMTDEEKKKVEDIINEKIAEKLPMQKVVMKKEDAEKTGALHFFGDKYGDEVNVYYIGDSLDTAYSKEFCGGPHVSNIGELGHFKIIKEESISAGARRIKAILE